MVGEAEIGGLDAGVFNRAEARAARGLSLADGHAGDDAADEGDVLAGQEAVGGGQLLEDAGDHLAAGDLHGAEMGSLDGEVDSIIADDGEGRGDLD
jgi:hypothetical protein